MSPDSNSDLVTLFLSCTDDFVRIDIMLRTQQSIASRFGFACLALLLLLLVLLYVV